MRVFLDPAERLAAGLSLLSDTVSVTLGPAGQHVLIEPPGGNPVMTKDGVTAASMVTSDDPLERLAIKSVIAAAKEMNTKVGDGTTSAVILTCALAKEIFLVPQGRRRGVLRRLEHLFEQSVYRIDKWKHNIPAEVGPLTNIATLACNNNRKLGAVVAEAVACAGADGVVTFQDAKDYEHSFAATQGLHIDKGFLSHYFINNPERGVAELDDCAVFLTDLQLTESSHVLSLVDLAHRMAKTTEMQGGKQTNGLLIIAPDIRDEALATLILNKLHRGDRIVAVKTPHFGPAREEALLDLAACTGATVFSESLGLPLKDLPATRLVEYVGKAGRVVVNREQTIIAQGAGNPEEVEKRAADIRERLPKAASMDKTVLQMRLARLAGGVGVVYVGGVNETDLKANKYLVEDAINACYAALRHGVVPAGGQAYRWAHNLAGEQKPKTLDEETAVQIFQRVMLAPVERLFANAVEGGKVGHQTHTLLVRFLAVKDKDKRRRDLGYNVMNGKFEKFVSRHLIEPSSLPITAMNIAFGCGATLGQTLAAIARTPEDEQKKGG